MPFDGFRSNLFKLVVPKCKYSLAKLMLIEINDVDASQVFERLLLEVI